MDVTMAFLHIILSDDVIQQRFVDCDNQTGYQETLVIKQGINGDRSRHMEAIICNPIDDHTHGPLFFNTHSRDNYIYRVAS